MDIVTTIAALAAFAAALYLAPLVDQWLERGQ